MDSQRLKQLRFATLIAILVLVLVSGSAVADQNVRVDSDPKKEPDRDTAIDLMQPIKDVLSGQAWLISEGLDPGMWRRPGWNALTRMDWRKLDTTFTELDIPASGPFSPSMQAPGAVTLVPFRDPGPAFSRDMLITRDFSRTPYQTEPHIAVNPNDTDHVVVGVIDYNFPSVTSYVSLDGGANWEGPFQKPYLREDRTSGGDPVLAFDRDGNVYFTSISIGIEEFSIGPIATFSMVSSIQVAVSENGGFTWKDPVSTSRSTVDTADLRLDEQGRLRGTVTASFLDKPWMASGLHPDNPNLDVVYLTYTKFETLNEIQWVDEVPALMPQEMRTSIEIVRIEDGGETWSDPVRVSPLVRRAFGEVEVAPDVPGVFGTRRVVQGSQPVVGQDGSVYVAWLDSTDDGSMKGRAEIHTARSEDGGETFTTPEVATSFNDLAFRPRNAMFRYWGAAFPQIAIGPEDDLYIAYTGRPAGKPADDGDIFVIRSFDRGETWSRPTRVNDDDGNALQFFPAIDVDPNGVVHVMWGDMRDDPSQIRFHIYYTRSEDQGDSWGFEFEDHDFSVGDTRVTDFPSNPNYGFPFGLFIGDYFAIEATGEDVYMVWADTRLGEFGAMNQKIGFARERPISSPDIHISPSAGAGGQGITIRGFDFQPDMNIFIQVDDVTMAVARTDAEGAFSTAVYMPVINEGAQSISAVDASGNRAATSYFTEFGFGDLERLLDDVQLLLDGQVASPDIVGLKDELQELRGLIDRQELEAEDDREGGVFDTFAGWLLAIIAAAAVVGLIAVGAVWIGTRRNDTTEPDAPGEEQDESATG